MENLIIIDPNNEYQLVVFDKNLDYQFVVADEFSYMGVNGQGDKIKIGKTSPGVISSRFSSLRTMDPDLEVKIIFPKTVYSEDFLKQKFKDYRYKKELYFYANALKEFIENEQKQQLQLQKYYQASCALLNLNQETKSFFNLIAQPHIENHPKSNNQKPRFIKINKTQFTINSWKDIIVYTFQYLVDNNIFTEQNIPFQFSKNVKPFVVSTDDDQAFSHLSHKIYNGFKYNTNYSSKDCVKVSKKLMGHFLNDVTLELIY